MNETALLDDLLRPGGLIARFQPIFDLSSPAARVFAYEGLSRGRPGSPLEDAEALFAHGRDRREECLVDRACVANLLRAAAALPARASVALNVHAATLARDRGFTSFLLACASRQDIAAAQLVLEIVEHAPAWDAPGLSAALASLRMAGVRIALDDVGTGQANYRLMLETRPDLLKIDRYFVHGAHADRARRAVLRSIADLGHVLEARTIAEGLEDPRDLAPLLDLGIHLVQGYLLGRPAPASELGALAQICDRRAVS